MIWGISQGSWEKMLCNACGTQCQVVWSVFGPNQLDALRRLGFIGVKPLRGDNDMLGRFTVTNKLDGNGNPSGGHVTGVGMSIDWQDGPLGRGADRIEHNGAFVETVIAAAKQRIEFYQQANGGKFACRENAMAITKLDEALMWLNKRTNDREARQVEGTHEK